MGLFLEQQNKGNQGRNKGIGEISFTPCITKGHSHLREVVINL